VFGKSTSPTTPSLWRSAMRSAESQFLVFLPPMCFFEGLLYALRQDAKSARYFGSRYSP
jgi:hypothetical protein